MTNFMDDIKNESKQYGGGGDSSFFKFEEDGVYQIRILSRPHVLATHFFGKGVPAVVCVGIDEGCEYHKEDDKRPSIKLVTYVIDRRDGKVKLAELPLSLSYSIQDLQNDSDFAFEEFPMPYDVKITYDPKNDDPKAKYRLVASPKMTDVTEDERAELNGLMEKMTPEDYVEKRKAKQKDKGGEVKASGLTKDIRDTDKYPDEDVDPKF